MAVISEPLDSQISWPVRISEATQTNGFGRSSNVMPCMCSCMRGVSFMPPNRPLPPMLEVEQAEHAALGQAAGEFFQLVELAGEIAAADQRADGGAGDHARLRCRLRRARAARRYAPSRARAAAKRERDARSSLREQVAETPPDDESAIGFPYVRSVCAVTPTRASQFSLFRPAEFTGAAYRNGESCVA